MCRRADPMVFYGIGRDNTNYHRRQYSGWAVYLGAPLRQNTLRFYRAALLKHPRADATRAQSRER